MYAAAANFLNLGFAVLRNVNPGPYNKGHALIDAGSDRTAVQNLLALNCILGAGLENLPDMIDGEDGRRRLHHELDCIYQQVGALRLPQTILSDGATSHQWQTWRTFCDELAAELGRPALYGIAA